MNKLSKTNLRRLTVIVAFTVAFLISLPIGAEEPKAIGNPKAPVTIVEFFSLSCPHCAEFHIKELPWIKKEYVDTGKVRFVFRDFPLNAAAAVGAMLIRCMKSEDYFKVLDMLFQKQKKWAFSKDTFGQLFKIAQTFKMTKSGFDICMADKKLLERIMNSAREAHKRYDINSTPSFLINGQLIDGHSLTREKLNKLIKAAVR